MIETPTPNVGLLTQTLDRIKAEPDRHRQGAWISESPCGTAFCFAGWAAVLDGVEPPTFPSPAVGMWWVNPDKTSEFVLLDEDAPEGARPLPEYAQAALGLTAQQRGVLFFGGNSASQLGRFVENIIAGENIYR